ncbi:MAG: NYN domain-containing protein [Aquabacterium sp.]
METDLKSGRVLVLIDADNVSADVIEQALAWVVAEVGAAHVRRAYGTAEAAVKHQALLRRLGIRPMVNLASGKNSTDIALAVDAVALAASERPAVAVIVSSDSDFAPLVLKLREFGCRVIGIGQTGKVGAEVAQVYDRFVILTHQARRGRSVAAAV